MYNRYIRNDQGGYTRVPEPEQSGRETPPQAPSEPQSGTGPPPGGERPPGTGHPLPGRRLPLTAIPQSGPPMKTPTIRETAAWLTASPAFCATCWTSFTWTAWIPGICCCWGFCSSSSGRTPMRNCWWPWDYCSSCKKERRQSPPLFADSPYPMTTVPSGRVKSLVNVGSDTMDSSPMR